MYLALNGGDTEKAKKTHTMMRVPYVELNVKPPKVKHFLHSKLRISKHFDNMNNGN